MQANFERNEKITQAINRLYDHLKDADYGTEYTWEQIKGLTGVVQLSKERLYYICHRVNDLLMAESKYLETVPGVGKRILNPNEHTVSARKKVKSAVRVYKKAGSILAATNMDMLDEQGKVQALDEAKKWSTLEHIHTELLKKKPKQIKEKAEAQRFVFDLIGYLKGD